MTSVNISGITNMITLASRYLIMVLMAIYCIQSYTVFGKRSVGAKKALFLRQNVSMFFIQFIAFLVMFMEQQNIQILFFYLAQLIFMLASLLLLCNLYPRASRLLINHMCMLITLGLIMITRLSYDSAVKQFWIVAAGMLISLLIPQIVRRAKFLTRITWLYTLTGIALLALVLVISRTVNGAKLSLSIGGFSLQPSEFVKIIFVFAAAGLLQKASDLKRVIIATILAAAHVLILVVSRDLGSALIFFLTYMIMLFAATGNPFLTLAGMFAGSGAAVAAYYLFSHVRIRVEIWRDPFADYTGKGYQISQSLFSISAGGWIGTGIGKGSPGMIPYVQQDCMFSAICEELGCVVGICLILICLSCCMMFVNSAMLLKNHFYRLTALGLASVYAVQIFLTVGGGMKLIPMTGVTLPLVSYGGSSALSTIAMFAIIQGIYLIYRDEEEQQKAEIQGGEAAQA